MMEVIGVFLKRLAFVKRDDKVKIKGKGKFHHKTDHEGPERE
jgi:hypothetical protein